MSGYLCNFFYATVYKKWRLPRPSLPRPLLRQPTYSGSQPTLRSTHLCISLRWVSGVQACLAGGVARYKKICIGCHVTLCDPIRQVTLRSFEMGSPWRAIPFNMKDNAPLLTWHAGVRPPITVCGHSKWRQRAAWVMDVDVRRPPCSHEHVTLVLYCCPSVALSVCLCVRSCGRNLQFKSRRTPG